MPFHGIHDHTLDAKNRLTVPAKARPELAGGVTVVKGFETCLQVWPAADYTRVAQQALAGLNPLGPEARDLKRHLYGNASSVDLDAAGRVNLSRDQLEHAGLSKEVVVVGSGEYLEVWDRDAWKTQQSDLIARAADHIASVGHPA